MRELQKGMFVRSLAGHDKGKLYIVISLDEGFVYAADGRIRTLDNLKKKNRRHVQPDYTVDDEIRRKIENDEVLRDEDLRRAITAKNRLETDSLE